MIMARQKILSIDDLSDSDIGRIFFAEPKKCDASMMTAFFEPSTRTRLSFIMAAHRLGLKLIDFDSGSSSLKKGESIDDTIRTLDYLGPDVLVCRMAADLDSNLITDLTCGFINAGDGSNEHPSQALLDCFSLLEYWQCDDLSKKHILIIGDIAHSRVAHSNIKLMQRLGARVSQCHPPHDAFPKHGDEFSAVMVLRIQKERLLENFALSDHDYASAYQMTDSRLKSLGEDCVLLHPGPMNIGLEISAGLANHPRSLIAQQVKNGVRVRAGLLYYVLNGG